MKEGIADGSLATEFPEECAEVFLLLMNVWCDPAVFSGNAEKLEQRMRFLQHMMKAVGIDILSDELMEKSLHLIQKIYAEN